MRFSTCLAVVAAVLLASPMATAQSALQNSTLDRAGSAAVIANGGTFKPSEGTTTVLGDNRGASLLDLSEGFDDITTLAAAGWSLQNLSTPVGTTGWFQGNSTVFPAQSGPATSYIGANFNNVSGAGTISNWLITPQTALENGTTLKFFTRTGGTTAQFPDRLEIRISTAGASTNVGATNTSVGDFTTVLLTINPTLQPGAANYPVVFTEFTATVSGLAAPTSGRFAFRYFVTDGGTGANSNFIGIDNVRLQVTAPVGPALAANPTSLSFGTAQTVGTTSAPQTVTLSNGGTTATTVTGITSSNAAFAVTAPAFPLTIAAGGMATFTVRFTPANTTAQTGNILVASNAPGSPLTIAVSGTGNADVTTTVPTGTTVGGPLFNRSTGAVGSCVPVAGTGSGSNVAYVTRPFTVATAGSYTITTNYAGNTPSYDGYIILYQGTFDPAASCTNRIAFNDDFGGLTGSQIANQALTAGSYVLVVTGFANASAGTFTGTVVGPAAVTFQTTAGEGTAGNATATLSASPNPVRDAARVRFTTATAQTVTVAVYDVTGRQIATLFQGAVAADQTVEASLKAAGLPSGVYVVRATGADVNLTQRVTVVR